jgi:hypothetical protein
MNTLKNFFGVSFLLFLFFIITSFIQRAYSESTSKNQKIKVIFFSELRGPEGDTNYLFSKITKVSVDREENIYILDSGNQIVKKYDKDFKYKGTIGDKGQGPGEYMFPYLLKVSDAGKIYIYDWGLRKLNVYRFDGSYINSLPFSDSFLIDLDIDSKENLICLENIFEDKKGFLVLRKYNREKKFIMEICRVEQPEHTAIPLKKGVFRIMTKFHPMLHFTIGTNDNVYVGFSRDYKIDIYNSEGNRIRRVEKNLEKIVIPEKEKEEELRRQLEGTGVLIEKINLDNINLPLLYPAFEKLIVDSKGRLWVITFRKDKRGNSYIDIFDLDKNEPFTITLNISPWIIKGDFLYSIEEDQEGFQHIKKYKIVEK